MNEEGSRGRSSGGGSPPLGHFSRGEPCYLFDLVVVVVMVLMVVMVVVVVVVMMMVMMTMMVLIVVMVVVVIVVAMITLIMRMAALLRTNLGECLSDNHQKKSDLDDRHDNSV